MAVLLWAPPRPVLPGECLGGAEVFGLHEVGGGGPQRYLGQLRRVLPVGDASRCVDPAGHGVGLMAAMAPESIDLAPLGRALATLEDVLLEVGRAEPGRVHDMLRDAAIKRFEYAFELAWKFMRRAVLALGSDDPGGSARPILRRAGQERMIEDVEAWLAFLAARNATAHQYDVAVAAATFALARTFLATAAPLVARLRSCIDAA